MRRTLLLLVVAAVSCGGSQKTNNPPPLPPETKTEPPEPKPAPPEEKPAPPAPPKPLDVSIEVPKTTVKLVSPGKGKRVALKFTPKQGNKQQIELALDLSEKQTAPAELGGSSENTIPTVVLIGEAEVKSVDDKGKAEYQLTLNDADTRDTAKPTDEQTKMKGPLKEAFSSLKGMTIGGTIEANGEQGDVKLHMDKGDENAQRALELLVLGLPRFPLLPTEPIGVGAKWQATSSTKLLGKVEATQTTDYELVAHKGNTWTIKGTTKVAGNDQDLDTAKLSKIAGTGNLEVALVDGALYPTMKGSVASGFTASVSGPDPSDQTGKTMKTVSLTINVTQGSAVTPK